MSTEQTNPRDVIAQALALSEAATDGPWEGPILTWQFFDSTEEGMAYSVDAADDLTVASDAIEEDAAFIAAARTLLPAFAKALGDVLDGRANHAESCGCGSCSHYKRNVKAITAALSEVTP